MKREEMNNGGSDRERRMDKQTERARAGWFAVFSSSMEASYMDSLVILYIGILHGLLGHVPNTH